MNVNGKPTRSIRADASGRAIHIIDQTRLPFALETRTLTSMGEVATAITSMQVRGAPLIGVTAAFGLAMAMAADSSDRELERACALLLATRPTAVNLAWALARMKAHLHALQHQERASAAWGFAQRLADEDAATNAAIGEHGLALIRGMHDRLQRPINILTHCNAGWIATVDWGTALACIYKAHDAGFPVHVWVDETRPRNQGLLTAWELRGHGVPHTYIVDNAGGHLMQHGKVDMVLVGADRVSRQGDVANKIGTYLKALAAHDNQIPFYAALPVSTIDPMLNDALRETEIEERSADEVRYISGVAATGSSDKLQHGGASQAENGLQASPVLVLDPASAAANPAFDVTPARLITGIITERGVYAPADLATSLTTPA
jgi:methylthioribose-1-phosphate isomerase